MGNSSSRGIYQSKYPPKHSYYSEHGRRGQKPRKGGGGGRFHPEETDFGYMDDYASHPHSHSHSRSHSRYPSTDSYRPHHGHGYDLYPGHEPVQPPPLQFPNNPAQATYPVIPPIPYNSQYSRAPPVIPNSSFLTQPTLQMPEPAPASAPVIPSQYVHRAHTAPVVPHIPHRAATHHYAPTPPVVPPSFPMPSQKGPPVVLQAPSAPDGNSPPFHVYHGEPLAPGQYGHQDPEEQVHIQEPIHIRSPSPRLRHNPLPAPPRDVFASSPFIGLLKELHRPPEESLLRRAATSPPYATGYIISPTPPGSHASRDKKQRKGLLRSISTRLGGKSKHEEEEVVPQAVYQPVVFTTGPILPSVIPPAAYIPAVPPPGTTWPAPSVGAARSPAPPEVRAQSPQVPRAPPSPAPSHRSHHSHHSHRSHHSHPIKIDLQNSFAGLTHLSPHRVHYNRKLYPTAFHLLEAMRFMGHRPDLAEQIRTCADPDEVRAIVSQNASNSRQDWEQIAVQMMDEVLYTKFVQHPDLRRLLLSTGAAELLYTSSHDSFWGDGPLGRGANELGVALEQVRDRLFAEGFTVDT